VLSAAVLLQTIAYVVPFVARDTIRFSNVITDMVPRQHLLSMYA
jgi:hypothetical protein